MTTIVHLSDLHFGREDPPVVAGLIDDVHAMQPDLVVNSGDFTQRARRAQFRAAADFNARLPRPQLAVPGNHDVPLFDVVRRFASPLDRYRRYIADDVNPFHLDDSVAVLGLNTARAFTWKSGRISFDQIELIERTFMPLAPDTIRVLVTHHPFIPPPGDEDAGVDLVGRADRALRVVARCQVDLLLAGHIHHGYAGDVRAHYPAADRSTIAVQAGTAASHRVRNEPNAYNVIKLERGRIGIAIRQWNGAGFTETHRIDYTLTDGTWERAL
jgi:3',5'-cyclic AMP phosphodiesterase CpdA